MKAIKNYVIALLAGLLVLTLSTQNSSGAGSSASAKAIQYTYCLNGYAERDGNLGANPTVVRLQVAILACQKYQP